MTSSVSSFAYWPGCSYKCFVKSIDTLKCHSFLLLHPIFDKIFSIMFVWFFSFYSNQLLFFGGVDLPLNVKYEDVWFLLNRFGSDLLMLWRYIHLCTCIFTVGSPNLHTSGQFNRKFLHLPTIMKYSVCYIFLNLCATITNLYHTEEIIMLFHLTRMSLGLKLHLSLILL